MKDLSVELQLIIIAHLPPTDIVHLQQTCKALHALVVDFGEGIWRECLLRQCLYNGAFWPTYKDLHGAHDLKNASTSGLRFIKACDEVSHMRPRPALEAFGPPMRSTTVEQPITMKEIHLIPGGRFIIIIEDRSIAMWDLQPQPPTLSVPSLVLAREFMGKVNSSSTVDVVNSMSLRILAELHLDSSASRHMLNFALLEIGLSDNATFTIRRECFLAVHVSWPAPPTVKVDAYRGNRVATFIQSTDDSKRAVTLVWDFYQDTWAFWWTEFDVLDIAMMDDCVLYFHASGVDTREIPPLNPVKDGVVRIAPYKDEDTDPSGLWSYKKPIELLQERLVNPFTGPDTFNPSHLADGRPIVYEATEAPTTTNTIQQRRYRLKQYHDGPKLQLVEKCRLTCADSNALEIEPVMRRICENRLVTFWTDYEVYPTAHYVSVSPPSTYASHPPRFSPARKSTFPLIEPNHQTSNDDTTPNSEDWECIYPEGRASMSPSQQ